MRFSFSFKLGATLSLLYCCVAWAQQDLTPAVGRLAGSPAGAPGESSLVALKGNIRPEARSEFDRGQVPASLPMRSMLLILKRSQAQEAALQRFMAQQQDPASANYHRWLTPQDFGALYGPAQSDVDTVTDWLKSSGFTVDSVSHGRTIVEFSGDAGRVQRAFHTEIHNLDVHGVAHIANMSDPSIPAALAPIVAGIQSLHNFFARPQHVVKGVSRFDSAKGWQPIAGSGIPKRIETARNEAGQIKVNSALNQPKPDFGIVDAGGNQLELLAPYDFASIYNVLPLWNAATAIDGAGETIAIAGTSNIVLSDVASFRSFFGLPPNVPTVIVTNTDPGTSSIDDLIENSLDVEWSGAVAKAAAIKLVTSSSTSTTDGLTLSEEYIVDNEVAPVMSVSYGECELGLGTGGNFLLSLLWQQAQAEGIAVFVAAGDQGSAGCDNNSTGGTPFAAQYGQAVNGIASTPYDVAVGGTDFNWLGQQSTYWGTNNAVTRANALSYIPEIPWNDTCTNPVVISLIYPGHTAEATCNAAAFSTNDYFVVNVAGGGGGQSTCIASDSSTPASCAGGYAKPYWQAGVFGLPSDLVRDLPDVSLFSSPGFFGSAYPVCVSAESPDGTCSFSNTTDIDYLVVGGTSASSPAMAGIMALINQKTGATQGNPNAVFYGLAAQEAYFPCSSESVTNASNCYFNDVDTGTNAMPCGVGTTDCALSYWDDAFGVLPGWAAGTGYDLATGLGTPNVANIVNNWPVSSKASSPTATLSASVLTFAGVTVGTAAAAQTITLRNSGTAPLILAGILIAGSGANFFTENTTCTGLVAAGKSCSVTVNFTPYAVGSVTATLSLTDNATGSSQVVTLNGSGIAPKPSAKLSVSSLAFAATVVGSVSASQTVTLTNSSVTALTIAGIAVSGSGAASFPESSNCGSTLAGGASCSVVLAFKPAAAGAFSATLTVSDNAATSAQTVTLTGTGVAAVPLATLSLSSLTFGGTLLGSTAASQVVTLKNPGTAPLSISSIALGGAGKTSFSESSTCGASLAVSASCSITVGFKPLVAGSLTGSVSVSDAAANSPQQIALTGTGITPAPAVTLSSTTLTFPATTEGIAAATQTVTLKNSGTAALAISSIAIVGANASSFTSSTTCAATLAVGSSCTISVGFKPVAAGTLTAAIDVADNAPASPQALALSGTGLTPVPVVSLSASALSFAGTIEGFAAAVQSLTLKNTGTKALTLSSIAISGTGAASFTDKTTCPASLAIESSCTISVTFAPVAVGALSASLTLSDNAATASQSVSLSGTGIAPTPSVSMLLTTLTFPATASGSRSPAQAVTVSNKGTAPLIVSSIAFTGTGATDFAQSNDCVGSLAVGASCLVMVDFAPIANGSVTAELGLTDNASGSPQSLSVTGTGGENPTVALSTSALTFGTVSRGSKSTGQAVTLTNSGATNLYLTGIALGGIAPGQFQFLQNCGAIVAPGSNCAIVVVFAPTVAGTSTATLTVTGNNPAATYVLSLSGVGQ